MRARLVGGQLLLATLAISLAALIVVQPTLAIAGLAILLGGGLVANVLTRRPLLAFSTAPFLVLLTWTKFRGRDASEALSGSVDMQVGFELGASAVLFLIALLAWKRARDEGRMRLLPVEWVLLVYAGLAILSTLWSPVRAITAVRSFQVLTLVMLAIGLVRVRGPERMINDLISAMILYTMVFVTISIVVPSTAAVRVVHGGLTRYSWFAMHPGQISLLAGSAIVLLTAKGLFGGGFRQRVLFLPVWVCLVGMAALLAASRGRGPAIGAAAAVIALLAARFLPRWVIPTVVATAAAAILVFINLGPQLSDVLASAALSNNPVIAFVIRGQTAEEFKTLSSRTDLWAVVFDMVVQQPILGHGYNSSRLLLLEKVPWAAHAHNAWAQSLLDLGIVGTSLLTVVVFSMFWPILPQIRITRRSSFIGSVALGIGILMALEAITSESFASGSLLDLMVLLTGVSAAAASINPSLTQASLAHSSFPRDSSCAY